MGKSEFGKGNSHRDLIAKMTAGNRPYLADQIGKCIRHVRTETGQRRNDINLCLRDSVTYAASEAGRKIWEEFRADRAQEGWLHWLETFQPRQWRNPPFHVLVDWDSGIFARFSKTEFGCSEDVKACLYDSDDLRGATRMHQPPKFSAESLGLLEDLTKAEESLKTVGETERKALVDARCGQGKYRRDLIGIWGRCAVTKCKDEKLLRASHIKPWRYSNNAERLDMFNGLLLTPALDHLFDRGLVGFTDDGSIRFAPGLKPADALLLGVHEKMKLCYVDEQHKPYLAEHRRLYSFDKSSP